MKLTIEREDLAAPDPIEAAFLRRCAGSPKVVAGYASATVYDVGPRSGSWTEFRYSPEMRAYVRYFDREWKHAVVPLSLVPQTFTVQEARRGAG